MKRDATNTSAMSAKISALVVVVVGVSVGVVDAFAP